AAIPDPKVNILFVVDNSGSMDGHQATLKANIAKFADTFFKNPRLDYKIGVVPVYDSTYLDGQAHCRLKTDVRKMNKFAELVPLKNADGSVMAESVPFITRDTANAEEVLKQTVALGTQCGPEAEESFSPVLGVIDPQINQTKNSNFYDKDAFLVVIFLTDADDISPGLNAGQFYEKLVAAKGGDRSKVLIAAALPDKERPGCTVDSVGPQFADLISISNGSRFNLCSNSFGTELVTFGNVLVEKVAQQRIELDFIPDTRLKITYGKKGMRDEEMQTIEPNVDGGYTYLPGTKTIILQANLNINRIEGGEIFITAYPIDPKNFKNGRATTIGQTKPKK
ncbi:MAG: hypothetical protein KDD37_10740, partial [Bdellovibrionales bacterium]|nr:hypothetical protein [Bdellovibrionales bacterium]